MTTVLRRMRAAAQGAELRTATFEGRSHVVAPIVLMVGDIVVHPMHSEGGEFVASEVLAEAPSQWDGRPVVPGHPANGTASANEPATLERERFGLLFNSRFDDGRLKSEAWLDVARAEDMGGDAADAVRRLREGEVVEVSVGAWVTLVERAGSIGGERFEHVWEGVASDHLAMLRDDEVGACSVEDGCGCPRLNSEGHRTEVEYDDGFGRRRGLGRHGAVIRAAVRSEARRPTFDGTETAEWSTPSFGDYVDALFSGDDPPADVADASADLRRAIASRTLLGEADADNRRDLIFFPVVNPDNDALNENALRAVLGGRGAQADIPAAALESARDMARRLLNSEFDADLEVNVKRKTLIARAKEALGLRAAQDDDESMSHLQEELWKILRAEVPAFEGIVDVFIDSMAVVFAATPDGPTQFFRQGFARDDGEVSLVGEAMEVELRQEFVPVAAQGDDATLRDAAEGLSDNDLRELLTLALGDVEADALNVWVEAVFDDVVVYELFREDEPPATFERGYEVGEDESTVTLGDERVEVVRDVSYRPVAAAAGDNDRGEGAAAEAKEQGMDIKELIAKIIGHEASPFEEGDEEGLEAFGEKKLSAMADGLDDAGADDGGGEPAAGDPQDDSEPGRQAGADEGADGGDADADVVTVPRERLEEMEEALAERRAAREAEAKGLAAKIAEATDEYDEKELLKQDVESLRRLSRALKVDEPKPDYSALGLPLREDDDVVPAPPDQAAYSQALRAGKSRQEAMEAAREGGRTH